MKREASTVYLALIMAAIIVLAGGPINTAFASSSYTFTRLDIKGALSSAAVAVNDHNQVVGYYYDIVAKTNAYVYSNGKFTGINVDCHTTMPVAINIHGDVGGYYLCDSKYRGFLYSSGTFQSIDFPHATRTQVSSINEHGNLIGWYYDKSGKSHSFFFLKQTGAYKIITVPGAIATAASEINNHGEIAGSYTDSANRSHGFLLDSKGKFQTIDFPHAQSTELRGLNDNGQVIGQYRWNASSSGSHCFLYSNGHFKSIGVSLDDFVCSSINNHGDILGHYSTGDPLQHFIYASGKLSALDFKADVTGLNDQGSLVGIHYDGHLYSGFLATRNDKS